MGDRARAGEGGDTAGALGDGGGIAAAAVASVPRRVPCWALRGRRVRVLALTRHPHVPPSHATLSRHPLPPLPGETSQTLHTFGYGKHHTKGIYIRWMEDAYYIIQRYTDPNNMWLASVTGTGGTVGGSWEIPKDRALRPRPFFNRFWKPF